MFLKSIELFGFKSFADRSRIEFTDGISALLGPNGCGKSNVVDAIKWVLGEQATKSLRADHMEDIIFNGTESRKALNVAEVALTLANETGILPIDSAEISIRRRLFRSGESEYFVNNTPAKLKEIRELFYDTGIGKSAYSIMEQGKIDQVLSNKPEERRSIFEEAAGITKYKAKGQEAERKLERTEENMRQIDGILGEVKRSYDSLKKQADKTLQYRDLRDRSFNLELDIQLLRLKAFIDERDLRQSQLKDKSDRRDATRKEIDTINESLEENLDQVNSMEAKLIDSQKKLYGVELEKNNQVNQTRLLQERIVETEEKHAADIAREKSIAEKLASLRADVAERQKSLEEFTVRIEETESNIAGFEKNIESATARIRENETSSRRKDKEIHDFDQRQEALQNDLRGLTDDIVQQLDQGLKESGYSYQERLHVEEELSQVLESVRILTEGRRNLFADAGKIGTAKPEEIEKVVHSGAAAFEELHSQIARLAELFSRYRTFTPAFLDDFLAPEGIITRKRDIDEEILDLRAKVRANREEIARLGEENRALAGKIDEYRKTLEELRMSRVRLRTQMNAVTETIERNLSEIADQEKLLAVNHRAIEDAKERIDGIRRQIDAVQAEQAKLEDREKTLRGELASLEKNISVKNRALVDKEKRLKGRMEELGKTQTQVEKLQMDLAEVNAEIRNIYTNFRERHSRELSEYETRMLEITAVAKDLRDQLTEIREEQRKLGQVNLMAPEEFSEVKDRYDFLSGQLEDLRKAKEDLVRVTGQIRTESAELFLDTYEKIKKNFHSMFRRLFGGGRAELKLVEGQEVLESGIEILVQPPGKKLESIALLSGGERALTAVALLFATYMVKPSPFCLLDEIDAALDENNVGRFVSMLSEFGNTSQFIVITHNKKTVAGAKTLLGVTMEESGVSKVIALRLDRKEPVHAG
ncbi:MAG TPA: AAA family ATPase [Spirochaetia bacterium]|nr:AAA family ATPase [Spirochaetia bacterium]